MKFITINEFKQYLKENHYYDEGSNGDFADNNDKINQANNLYDQGKKLFDQGNIEVAEQKRQEALKIGSFLNWDENDLPPYSNTSISTHDIKKYYDDVLTLVLAGFSDREKQMAGLTKETLEKELSEFRNEHGEGEMHYKQLTMSLGDYYEHDISAEEASQQILKEFRPLVIRQLGAM